MRNVTGWMSFAAHSSCFLETFPYPASLCFKQRRHLLKHLVLCDYAFSSSHIVINIKLVPDWEWPGFHRLWTDLKESDSRRGWIWNRMDYSQMGAIKSPANLQLETVSTQFFQAHRLEIVQAIQEPGPKGYIELNLVSLSPKEFNKCFSGVWGGEVREEKRKRQKKGPCLSWEDFWSYGELNL